MVLVECWNVIGDLGAAVRSSDRKRAEAEALAVALGGEGGPFAVGLCWVVRATRRNRDLLSRYPHIFDARFPGSSLGWLRALTTGDDFPSEPGIMWCDLGAMCLVARRRKRLAEPSDRA